MIGIAADALRNAGKCYNKPDSLALYFRGGATSLEFMEQSTPITPGMTFPPNNGDRVLVKVDRIANEV